MTTEPENPETTRLRALTDQLRASTAEMRAHLTPELLASLTPEQRAVLAHDLVLLGEVTATVKGEIETYLAADSGAYVAGMEDDACAGEPTP